MDTDAASMFWFFVPGVLIPAVLLVAAFRSPSPRQMGRWAASCGVEVRASNEEMVRSRLGRARRFRSVAAFPFWWMATGRILFGAGFPSELASPVPALVAYALGSLVAELSTGAGGAGTVREASMSPRTAGDYRPGWLGGLPWVLLGLAFGLLLIPGQAGTGDARSGALILLVIGASVAALAALATRRVVQRPQRSGDLDCLAADDALRATAVSMTSGLGVLAGLGAATAALQATVASPTSGWWVLLYVGALLPMQAVGIGVLFCIIRQQTWGYRPRHRQAVMAGVP